MVDDFGSDPYALLTHLPEAEKWAKHMLKRYPQADEEIVLLAVWLHDLGHYPTQDKIDHAVLGEQAARAFLESENYPKDRMERVLHCVRSHRCKDVMPESFEAKIVAFVDSASHMTDMIYFGMSRENKRDHLDFAAYSKIERDFRDLSSFPEVQKELKDIYEAWKVLLRAYEKIDLA